VGGLVGVAVEVDGRLDVLVAELLLDEVDRLARGEPERRGGVAEVVEADRGGQRGVSEGCVVGSITRTS